MVHYFPNFIKNDFSSNIRTVIFSTFLVVLFFKQHQSCDSGRFSVNKLNPTIQFFPISRKAGVFHDIRNDDAGGRGENT